MSLLQPPQKVFLNAPLILVVDDDPDILRMLKTVMEDDGYRVLTGDDGQMGLALALQHRPNLVVMDVNMPMTNGLRALEYMRQQPSLQETPIIFLTGDSNPRLTAALQNYKRVGLLSKPVDLFRLRAIIHQVVGVPS